MADIIQIRRDTAANWTSVNPTLAEGELGLETDTKKLKVGDGSTAWNSLGYYTLGVAGYILGSAAVFTGSVSEQVYNLTTEGATPTLDASNGTIQTQTIAADTTYTDSLANGEYITLMVVDATGYVITWPAGTSWVGGSAPTLATTGYSVIEFWKVGTTLYAAYVGDVA